VKDFWAEPSYAQLLLACRSGSTTTSSRKGPAQEALDSLVTDWEKVFKATERV